MNIAIKHALTAGALAAGLIGSAHAQEAVDPPWSDPQANTALGSYTMRALFNSGHNPVSNSTAFGDSAMLNSLGASNSAFGAYALAGASGSSGTYNSALGTYSLYSITNGTYNTAVGFNSLSNLTSGSLNTAIGSGSMQFLKTGVDNDAFGYAALVNTTTGSDNTALGLQSLWSNEVGNENVAVGSNALIQSTGSNNVAVGFNAGNEITAGSNNVDIASEGVTADNGIIRIGTAGSQTETFVAGIANSKVTGSAVYITSSGQLGTLASAERYKTEIASMGSATDKLMRLRPVTFHLKSEPAGVVQYGLIAEEVDKVYPELAIHDAEDRLSGVRYDELAPMLLNEFQKQQQKMTAQKAEIRSLKEQFAIQSAQLTKTQKQVAELNDLKKELQAAILELHRKHAFVAQR
jgi:hypothetical protein